MVLIVKGVSFKERPYLFVLLLIRILLFVKIHIYVLNLLWQRLIYVYAS